MALDDKKFMEMLIDKKVADAYQYYESSSYKLYLAKITISALENIVNDFCTSGEYAINDHLGNGFEECSSYIKTSIDYFGVELSIADATTKFCMEIISLLHNFFDNYAQWINAALLGEDAIPMDRVNLNKLVEALPKYPEYSSEFLNDVKYTVKQEEYKFISDFNNTIKHRAQLYTKNRINIITGKAGVFTSTFYKDKNSYSEQDVVSLLKKLYEFCERKLNASKSFIEEFYSKNDCKYVESRAYPTIFLQFKNENDHERFKIDQCYVYIEEKNDRENQEYQVMLKYDGDSKTIIENSYYQHIILKRQDEILGVLTPKDDEVFQNGDERALIYRKYILCNKNLSQDIYKDLSVRIQRNGLKYCTVKILEGKGSGTGM